MDRRTAGTLAGTAALALTATMVAGPAQASPGAQAGPATKAAKAAKVKPGPGAIGLTAGQKLVGFKLAKPGSVTRLGQVSGLTGDTQLVGIDFRVQDRKLYGVGNRGGIYTVSTRTAVAYKVSQLTVPLAGSAFGVDFNPAADRLRVTSDTGQNLRHDLTLDVTAADGTLTYPPVTTPATGISASAYTNNDLALETGTTLFDLDTALDQAAIQAPANAGPLSVTGKLGVDATSAGFDIYSELGADTTRPTAVNLGFATLTVGGRYELYTVSLSTGDATLLGAFPASAKVVDLAVRLDAS